MGAAFVITDSAEKKRKWFRMMEETGKSLIELMVQWGGVLNRTLIAFTPPRAGKNAEGEDQNAHPNGRPNWPEMKKSGNRAIERDIKYLFPELSLIHVISHPSLNLVRWAKDIKKYIDQKNFGAVSRMLQNAGLPTPLVLQKADRAVHQSARDERGRVRRGVRYPIIDVSSREPLIKQLQLDVGKAKAGWITGKMAVSNIPAWVRRHSMPDGSDVDLNGPNYRIVFRNTSPASSGMGADLMVDPAMEIVGRKFDKALSKTIEHNAKKFNTGI